MKAKATSKAGTRLATIFLLEDHPIFRRGLAQILNDEPDLKVCGEAGTTAEALPAVLALKPDLVVVDISLPGTSGLQFIKELRKKDKRTKLLVVSMHDEALYANRVLRAGGDGYIMKQESPEEIVHAIRDVLGGHLYLSESVLGAPREARSQRAPKAKIRPLHALTDLELEILTCLGQRRSAERVARDLGLSLKAVGTRCAQIKRKLKLKNDADLMRIAVRQVQTEST